MIETILAAILAALLFLCWRASDALDELKRLRDIAIVVSGNVMDLRDRR